MSHFYDEMDILSAVLNNINFDAVNFGEDDPETLIHIRLTACCNTFNQYKTFKVDISKELMPVAWHPARWWIGA